VKLLATLALLLATQLGQEHEPAREIAVTFDDLPIASVLDRDGVGWSRITDDLLAALGRHKVPAIGFVNEQKLERSGQEDPARTELLSRWLTAGMDLGNHTYSHLDFHSADVEVFQRDVLRGEARTRVLLETAGKTLRFLRHPFLHTGRSLDARRKLEQFLSEREYRVAPVTIDNCDYVYAAAYERATGQAMRLKIAEDYIRYLTDVVAYYELQSAAIVGREIRQVLLLHANALNAGAFDAIADMLRRRGYTFVSLDRALEDPAYTLPDSYVGPGGITWLHRWALTRGQRGAVFAGEPTVPEWIAQAALPHTKG
jgi:peptidoglycan/xylan/chitin deacetylase (PgdA/CDA1 family)